MSGFFLTFEGIDGCGKTTQAKRLVDALRRRGFDPLHTREPGGTPVGRRLRELLLGPSGEPLSWAAELLMMAADRAQHVAVVVRPALAKGRVVICERYVDSSIAYQGYGLQGDLDTVRTANRLATDGLLPDLTVLLDLHPAKALHRRGGDRIESRDNEFHQRVRRGYLALHSEEPARVVKIDADRAVDAIHDEVLQVLEHRLRPADTMG